MKTAKDLAYKAWRDAIKFVDKSYLENSEETAIKERFENWWKEWFYREDHKDCFHPEHNIFINGKRYIQAE
jgi:hypothetical protein